MFCTCMPTSSLTREEYQRLLPCVERFRVKRKHGQAHRLKSRFCCDGSKQSWVTNTTSPVASTDSFRMMVFMSVQRGEPLYGADKTSAFTQSDVKDLTFVRGPKDLHEMWAEHDPARVAHLKSQYPDWDPSQPLCFKLNSLQQHHSQRSATLHHS